MRRIIANLFAALGVVLALAWASEANAAETYVLITTTGAGTWTPPAGITLLDSVEGVGGGGGGQCLAGGGGGEYRKATSVTVAAGVAINLSVGAAGSPASNATCGATGATNGGDTFFGGTTCTAATLFCAKGTVNTMTVNAGGGGPWSTAGILLTLKPATGLGSGWTQYPFDQNNHLAYAGSNPVVSSCGTETLDAHATDSSGTINITAGTPASCTLTFAVPYVTYNHCLATGETALAAFGYSYTLTALTITGTSLSGKIDYHCDGS